MKLRGGGQIVMISSIQESAFTVNSKLYTWSGIQESAFTVYYALFSKLYLIL